MLSASLALDVKRFEEGARRAVIEMQAIDRAGKTTNRDLKRLLEDVSGQKIAVEAARVAEAVTRIGGASKLTETEQKRVNATISEAIAKYQALGQTAPAHLVALQQATAKASTSTSALVGAVGQMAAAFSVASLVNKGASALFNFASGALESAGELVDLRASTGASLQALQQWSHVASQAGIELTDMTTAAFKLGAKLDGGNGSVRDAVARLGLEFEKIQGLKPEAQMDQILRAADAMGSSQERNATLVELFGAKGAQSLARVVDGYRETADAAATASDAQVEALDRAGDAWGRLIKSVSTGTVTALGTLTLWAEDSMAAWSLATSGLKKYSAEQQAAIGAIASNGSEGLAEYLRSLEKATVAAGAAQGPATAATVDHIKALAEMKSHIAEVVSAQGAQLAAAIASGASTEEITAQFKLSAEEQRLYASSLRATGTASKETAVDLDTFREAVANLTGASALKDVALAMEQLQAAGGTLKVLPSQLDALAKQFTAGAEAARMLGDVELAEFYDAVSKELKPVAQLQARYNVVVGEYTPLAEDMVQAVQDQIDVLTKLDDTISIGVIPSVRVLGSSLVQFKAAVESSIPGIMKAAAEQKKLADQAARQEAAAGLRDLASALADLAQIGGGSDLGKLAQLIGAMAVGKEAGNQMRDALDKIKEGGNGAAAGFFQMAAGAVAAASALAKVTSEGTRTQRVVGGIATGAAIGSSILPGWGTVIGGVIGGVVGAVRSLDQATESNASHMVDWAKVISDATSANGRLRFDVVALIAKMRELGTTTQAVRDYMQAQSSSALTAFNAVAAGTVRWQHYGDAVKKAQAEVDRAKAAGDDKAPAGSDKAEAFKRAQDELTNALREQHRVADGAKGSLADLAVQSMAAFNAALASGMSYTDALKQIQPGIQAIIKAHQDLGLNIDNAALAALAMQSNLLAKNPEILAGIDAIAQGMLALGNIKLLDADTFAAMQRTAMEMFTRIQGEVAAMGGSTRDALLPMQTYLREAAAQAKLLNVPLDANTQMLIDQSKELGIWKDKALDPMEQIRDAAIEIRDAIREMTKAMKEIPPRVDMHFNRRYTSEGEPPSGGGTGESDRSGAGGGSRGGIQDRNGTYPIDRGAAATATGQAPMPPIDIHVTVKTDIDGRQVAEVVVPYIPDALRRRGVAVATWP